jgi:anti-sigma B factor antagonist
MQEAPAIAVAVPTRPLELEVRRRPLDDRTCVITVAGEIDLASAPALKSALAESLAYGHCQFILDLSRVAHMDSTGLGVLIGFQKRLHDDAEVAIAAAPDNVMTVLKITGLEARFGTFATVDEAATHFSPIADRRSALSTDAALVIGLASTALPFADSLEAEVERWLRILRPDGNAASVARELGKDLSDAPAAGQRADLTAEGRIQRIEEVVLQAERVAAQRGAETVQSADVLAGVAAVYGADFGRAFGG